MQAKALKNRSFFKSILAISSLTMMSRVFGFLRDVCIAHYLGAGQVADAFFVAFKFPNLFRRLFAEGAFSAAFIPVFTDCLQKNKTPDMAKYFAGQILGFLLITLIPLVALAQFFMPKLIYIIAPGFTGDPEKLKLTIYYCQICFPYLLFMSLVGFLTAILNSFYRFAIAAAAPILLNITIILALISFAPFYDNIGHILAWSVAIAGIFQFLLLVFDSYQKGVLPDLYLPTLSPKTKAFFKLFVPGAFSAGITQINLLIGTIFASLLPNAVSYLYYADRLNQLPLGVIGIAISVALLPMLSHQFQEGDHKGAHKTQTDAIIVSILLTFPAAVALFVIPDIIIHVLFERGAFGEQDRMNTSYALSAFALGLPAFVIVKVLSPAFFARKDTKTPMYLALLTMGMNVVLTAILMQFLGHVGIALATSISASINALCLYIILQKRKIYKIDGKGLRKVLFILIASFAMGGVLCLSRLGVSTYLISSSLLIKVAILGGVISTALILYALLVHFLKIFTYQQLKQVLFKK